MYSKMLLVPWLLELWVPILQIVSVRWHKLLCSKHKSKADQQGNIWPVTKLLSREATLAKSEARSAADLGMPACCRKSPALCIKSIRCKRSGSLGRRRLFTLLQAGNSLLRMCKAQFTAETSAAVRASVACCLRILEALRSKKVRSKSPQQLSRAVVEFL